MTSSTKDRPESIAGSQSKKDVLVLYGVCSPRVKRGSTA